MLILDEPTSGVDPLARDRFWELLIDLSRNEGVTIFVSTHFMNEAARCDRISLMDSGRVLATDTPATWSRRVAQPRSRTPSSAIWRRPERAPRVRAASSTEQSPPSRTARPANGAFSAAVFIQHSTPAADAIRESLESLRDPIRLGFALQERRS